MHHTILTVANATSAVAAVLQGSSRSECWAVAFGNSYGDGERCIAAGYDNGGMRKLGVCACAHAMIWTSGPRTSQPLAQTSSCTT